MAAPLLAHPPNEMRYSLLVESVNKGFLASWCPSLCKLPDQLMIHCWLSRVFTWLVMASWEDWWPPMMDCVTSTALASMTGAPCRTILAWVTLLRWQETTMSTSSGLSPVHISTFTTGDIENFLFLICQSWTISYSVWQSWWVGVLLERSQVTAAMWWSLFRYQFSCLWIPLKCAELCCVSSFGFYNEGIIW